MELPPFENLFVRHTTAVRLKKRIPNLRCYVKNMLALPLYASRWLLKPELYFETVILID